MNCLPKSSDFVFSLNIQTLPTISLIKFYSVKVHFSVIVCHSNGCVLLVISRHRAKILRSSTARKGKGCTAAERRAVTAIAGHTLHSPWLRGSPLPGAVNPGLPWLLCSIITQRLTLRSACQIPSTTVCKLYIFVRCNYLKSELRAEWPKSKCRPYTVIVTQYQ